MELLHKNKIIKRFLKENSDNLTQVELEDEQLTPYAQLGELLDYIELYRKSFFDVQTMEVDPDLWAALCKLIKHFATFERGSPPLLLDINLQKAKEELQNTYDINVLAKCDYYTRPIHFLTTTDPQLDKLIANSLIKLYALIQTFPEATPFDKKNSAHIASRIAHFQGEIARFPEDNPEKELLQKKMNILLDLNKITQLKRICIPQDNGSKSIYCTLAETVGGVTEKISLISLERVKIQLGHLCNQTENFDIENYSTEREHYKLSTQAIIKLPKHRKITEIQHEAIALNVSRLLGLDTAASTTVSYNGSPALFIPFTDVRLLSEFSSGKTFTGWFKNYTHYSTIKPLDEGIQADCFINDFGSVLGLIYLCSDTDAVGNNCQNKALINAKSLFIFDQAIKSTDKFCLDSRICLLPSEFLKKHTRHGLGRNRTIIEDSSMNSKFESIMQLKTLESKIISYVSHVSDLYHQKIAKIQQTGECDTHQEQMKLLTDLIVLKKDVELLKTKIQKRIAEIDTLFPQSTGVISSMEIKQALIFEKLMHNPVLFNDEGRPYKNPWTNRHLNNIKKIDALGNDAIQLTFREKVSPVMIDFIKRFSEADSITINLPDTISLSKIQLMALKEDMLYPEHQLTLNATARYLDLFNLEMLKEAYGSTDRIVINTISQYCAKMESKTVTPDEKIKLIVETEKQLKEYINTATKKGFVMHVIKKFYFDAQQHIPTLIPFNKIPGNLNEAFIAALKLDQPSKFHAVVWEAMEQNKMTDSLLTCFLDEYIQRAKSVKNYIEAQRECLALADMAHKAMEQLKTIPISCAAHILAKQTGNEELIPLTAIHIMYKEWEETKETFLDDSFVMTTISSAETVQNNQRIKLGPYKTLGN